MAMMDDDGGDRAGKGPVVSMCHGKDLCGGGATVVGAVMDDMEDIDLHSRSLVDESQRLERVFRRGVTDDRQAEDRRDAGRHRLGSKALIEVVHLKIRKFMAGSDSFAFVISTKSEQFLLVFGENIGFMDFLGFELASLSSQSATDVVLVAWATGALLSPGGMDRLDSIGQVTTMKSFVGMGILSLAGSYRGVCSSPVACKGIGRWLLALGVLAETRDVPQHSAPLDACDTCESEGNLLLQSQATEVRRGRGSMELELKAMAGQKIWDWKDKPMMLPGYTMDMNGRSCSLCGTPDASELWGDYKQRTDCGNHSIQEHPDIIFKPLKDFVHGDNNAWCELNVQKMCADAVYNKNYMIQAKQVNTTGSPALLYDATYCYHNGWLGAEYRALQFDFDAMKAKADKFCEQRLKLTKNMTLADMMAVYGPSFMRGEPSKEDALFLGAWTCAMGASGCDMTYCAYSYCQKPDGSFGAYHECEGWDPEKGMPVN
ncbi:unnamed protein product [Durusdinium trenchii]|uniref:Uncharacterized protein n=1 Tax=Durusdinium trenchii TaxID=1381693 RepID=A0ABP0MK54_9DINO